MDNATLQTDLVTIMSSFLTVTGLFFAALGIIDKYNEPLKTFLCASALLMSIIWIWSVVLLFGESYSYLLYFPGKTKITVNHVLGLYLPTLFLIGWFVAYAVHSVRWGWGLSVGK